MRKQTRFKPVEKLPQPNQPTASEPGIVAASVNASGRRVAGIRLEEAEAQSKKNDHVVWIGMHEPGKAPLERVAEQLRLHQLAIEDASNRHQQPKVEQYGDALFVVARTAQMTEGQIAFGETHLFVGKGYVVSVRHGAATSYKAVRERCESCPSSPAQGEDYILYAILDFIVDNYPPVIDCIQAEVDELKEEVLRKSLPRRESDRLHRLRRDLLRLHCAVGP